MPCQIVGTPAARVTRSSTISSASVGGRHLRARAAPGARRRASPRRGCPRRWRGTSARPASRSRASRRPIASGWLAHERVQDGRAVRVDDALGPAGGAARVTHGRGAVLVEVGELRSRGRRRRSAPRSRARPRARRRPSGISTSCSTPSKRGIVPASDGVEEDHPVLGVADDVAQVVLEQADVQRVQHRAHARHREVQLEVAQRVPPEASRRGRPGGCRAGAARWPAAGRARRPRRRSSARPPSRVQAHDLAVAEELSRPARRCAATSSGDVHHQALHGRDPTLR